MKKKVGGVAICLLILSSVSLYPVLGNPVEFLSAKKSGQVTSNPLSVSTYEDIQVVYTQLLDTVCKQEDPYEILCSLFSYPEVKDAIGGLSNAKTVHILEILFSKGHPLLKIVAIKQFGGMLEAMGQNKEVYQLESTLNFVITSNVSSPEDVFSFLNITVDPDDMSSWQGEWSCHVEKNPWIKNISENLEFNYLLFGIIFSVFIVLWGFAYGGLSVIIPNHLPDLVMLFNTVAFGLGSSALLGAFFSDIPPINRLVEFLSQYIGEDIILAVLSAAICLLVMGSYYVLGFLTTGTFNLIVQAFSCGLFVVWPPFLVALIATLFFGGV